mgnify:CR=1 FL=1
MAWISVHDSILGPKLRALARYLGCSQNEAIGILVRLWFYGLKNADRNGLLMDSTRKDVADAIRSGLSSEEDEKGLDPDEVVSGLIKANWIEEENGCYYLHDWSVWQSHHYAAMEKRDRDAERKRKERARARTSTPAEADASKPVTQPKPQQEKPKAPGKAEYPKGFVDFWDIYPNRKGKGEAYEKYKARVADGWSEEQLLEAARKYAQECDKQHIDKQYIKHAKTFLSNSTPFVDYLPEEGGGALNAAISGKGYDDDNPYGGWDGS